MSLAISLTDVYVFPRPSLALPASVKLIFRSQILKAMAEIFTLVALAIGLLTLFAGLSVI